MYALLAIGIALSPTRLDENTMIGLKDRVGEQYARMQRGLVVSQRIDADCTGHLMIHSFFIQGRRPFCIRRTLPLRLPKVHRFPPTTVR